MSRNHLQNKRKINQRGRKRGKRRTRQGASPGQRVFITPIKNKPIQTRAIRYIFDDTSSRVATTVTMMRRAMAVITNGSTSAVPIIDSFRILRVGATMLPNSNTGTSSFTFQWGGTNAPIEREVMYASQGIPSKRSFYPPDDSSAGWWWNNASDGTIELFSIDGLAVTSESPVYVDIEFEYVLADCNVSTFTISSASVTGLAYGKMANGALTPVDLTTFT